MITRTIEIIKEVSNIKITIKLHPSKSYIDIKSIVQKIDPKIPIYQDEDPKKLLELCDAVIINDISTIMLEAMIFKKPTLCINTQNQNIQEEPVIQHNASLFVSDIKDLKKSIKQLIFDNEQELEEQQTILASENEYRENLRPLYNQVFDKIKGFDEEQLNNDYLDFKNVIELKSKQEGQIKLIDGNIDNLKTKLLELEKYKYDENCDFCLENGDQQIKQKKDCETLLVKQKEEMKKIMSQHDLTMIDYGRLENIEEEKQKYDDLKDDLKQVEGDAYKTHAKIKELELSVEQVQSTLNKIMKDQELFLDNASAIAYNRNITHKIDKYENQVRIGSEILTEHKKELKKIESNILIEETNKKNLGEEIKDLVEAEQKVADYEVYLRLVSSDGIPQLIINDALPIIENEVNAVLDHMMAGFQLGITSEDKSINLYIRYDDQEWPLNLSSGMEKFVSSLALRVGLINVSNLPCPNFLVIDEGFGTLDTDNLSNMKGAFEYLKTRFDSVFIISHLDTIKDFMDYLLPVNVGEDGFSKVIYN